MGGTTCWILLKHRLPDDMDRECETMLLQFGTVTRDGAALKVVMGPHQGPWADIELDSRGFDLEAQASTALGWTPAQFIAVFGYDHPFLGRILLSLAERFQGVIHLTSVCHVEEDGPPPPAELQDKVESYLSRLHPEDRELPEARINAIESAGEEAGRFLDEVKRWLVSKTREHVARSSGKVVELKDSEGEVSYLVDAEYLREWIKNPHFNLL